jgi:hypothetical protein
MLAYRPEGRDIQSRPEAGAPPDLQSGAVSGCARPLVRASGGSGKPAGGGLATKWQNIPNSHSGRMFPFVSSVQFVGRICFLSHSFAFFCGKKISVFLIIEHLTAAATCYIFI